MSEAGPSTSARQKPESGLDLDTSARGKSHPKSATEARRKKILELNQMSISNSAIARELRCGTKTVRKDLRYLRSKDSESSIVTNVDKMVNGGRLSRV